MTTPEERREAAEAFSAWERLTRESHRTIRQMESDKAEVAYEAYDVIQAACNLMAALDVTQADLDRAARDVRMNNEVRGRYEQP